MGLMELAETLPLDDAGCAIVCKRAGRRAEADEGRVRPLANSTFVAPICSVQGCDSVSRVWSARMTKLHDALRRAVQLVFLTACVACGSPVTVTGDGKALHQVVYVSTNDGPIHVFSLQLITGELTETSRQMVASIQRIWRSRRTSVWRTPSMRRIRPTVK